MSEKRTLDPVLPLPWQNPLKARTVPFSLTISSTVHPLSSNFSTKAFTELVLLEWIGKECRKWNQTNRWKKVITNVSLLTKLLAVNGLIDDQSRCCSAIFLAYNQRQLFNSEWNNQPQKFQSLVQMLFKSINSLCQHLHHLQHDASKQPYPAWLQNHCLNPFDWSVHKSQQSTTTTKSWIKEKTSVPFWT